LTSVPCCLASGRITFSRSQVCCKSSSETSATNEPSWAAGGRLGLGSDVGPDVGAAVGARPADPTPQPASSTRPSSVGRNARKGRARTIGLLVRDGGVTRQLAEVVV